MPKKASKKKTQTRVVITKSDETAGEMESRSLNVILSICAVSLAGVTVYFFGNELRELLIDGWNLLVIKISEGG